jgi:hypothetical protein
MKRLLFVALFCFSSFAVQAADWVTNGVMTNPAANAILAESVIPADATKKFSVVVSTNVAAIVFVEWRDSTNTANLRSQAILLPANQTVQVWADFVPNFAADERIRIRLNTGVTGTMHGSLFIE